MVRTPCCDKSKVKRGTWTHEEDEKLKEHMDKYGNGGNWISFPQKAGLNRCGKSCRLRWMNYLRPNLKLGNYSEEEDRIICQMLRRMGKKWASIAKALPGRTDNDVKNYWNTKLKKRMAAVFNYNRNRYNNTRALPAPATFPTNTTHALPSAPVYRYNSRSAAAANATQINGYKPPNFLGFRRQTLPNNTGWNKMSFPVPQNQNCFYPNGISNHVGAAGNSSAFGTMGAGRCWNQNNFQGRGVAATGLQVQNQNFHGGLGIAAAGNQNLHGGHGIAASGLQVQNQNFHGRLGIAAAGNQNLHGDQGIAASGLQVQNQNFHGRLGIAATGQVQNQNFHGRLGIAAEGNQNLHGGHGIAASGLQVQNQNFHSGHRIAAAGHQNLRDIAAAGEATTGQLQIIKPENYHNSDVKLNYGVIYNNVKYGAYKSAGGVNKLIGSSSNGGNLEMNGGNHYNYYK